ncbi:MAG: hypothetical protein H7Y15_07015 [Pseudonocardia sp.]|nr:hypothetical protein [Pseudonocardia sp.]
MNRLAATLSGVTLVVSFVFSYGPEPVRMSLGAALLISVAAAGAVWLSSRRPIAALVVVSVLALGLPVIGSTFAVLDLVVVFVVFQAVLTADLPAWAVAATCLVTLTVNDAWQRTALGQSFMEPSVLYPLLLTALSVGLGLQSRQVRRQHAELVALRDADRQRAVSDERRRIARDLHDVAAHHLSALVVHNKLARRIGTEQARHEAVEFTAQTAADALDSLRQVVHVLNTEREAPLAPFPRLADLDGVVARMEAAGLHVERAAPVTTGGEVDAAVVRIASEALANVLRHRGPGRAWLDVARHHDTGVVTVTVEDDGPSTWSADAAWHRPGGYGMIGMRERAEACGGHLVVGPSPRGGWKVSAVLPAP